MTRKTDVERRLNDIEGQADKPLASMPTEELREAWRAAIDPERPTPVDGAEAYTELLGRKGDDA